MAYFRKCIICGCSLDPGEGDICTECEAEEIKTDQPRNLPITNEYEQLTLNV